MIGKKILLFLFPILTFFVSAKSQVDPVLYYKALQDEHCQQWVDSVFNKMTLKERVGQLFIYTIAPDESAANKALLRDVVRTYKVGGLLFSGGALEKYARLINEAQEMAETPLMITFDGEWGLGMRIKTIPAFPRNMILGSIQDEKLIYEYGKEVARQCRELGVHVNFAPVADVNVNPRNPVINTRSFGEDPVNVADKVIAYASGLESGGVLSVFKHFPGHGDTDTDSHHALPVLNFSRERMDSVELYPFREGIRAGLGGMMVGHLEVPSLESTKGLPSSLSRRIVTDLLINELGFRGLVFTDALAMQGAKGNNVSLRAIQAGNDLVLTPRKLKNELDVVFAAIKKGDISEEEINRKCKKILTYKYALGVHKQEEIQLSGLEQRINTPETEELIRQLNLAAITVAKNENNLLPLHSDIKDVALLNIGPFTNNGVFTETLKSYVTVHQISLKPNMGEAERKKLHETLASYKRIIVCVTERQLAPYQKFLSEFAPMSAVAYVFFTNDKTMHQIQPELLKARAVILAHNNDKFVQGQVGNAMFGKAILNGHLSVSVGKLFKAGDRVTLSPLTPYYYNPDEYGMRSRVLTQIDSIALEGIRKGAYPGCQIVILKDGKTMYDKCFGTLTGEKNSLRVTPNNIYDIASLTKTTGTLLAVMKLYDKGLFNLTDRISKYLPYLRDTDKEDITIRELLFHESGLPSSIFFYQKAIDPDSYDGRLFSAKKDASHTVKVGARSFAQPRFAFRKGLISPEKTETNTMQITDNMWLNKAFRDTINDNIVKVKLGEKKYRYSCVGFVLLQKLVEKLAKMPLDEYLQQEFYGPMGLERTAFLPLRYFPKEEIVPSTKDPFLRKTTIRGHVHDETAAFQGGISGNAGLFSTAREIARIHQMILNGGELDGKRYLSKETCRLFTTAKSKNSRRGLGFDKPDMKDNKKSPCSEFASASVYGHTGFTGTCAWVDPDKKLIMVFISNRIYPDPWVNELSKQNIRSRIQDAMYQSLR
ncbi:MAG: serine hydrolase [Bacteroides sp.]|nr:serine hydrolase [Bacteroides sp.]